MGIILGGISSNHGKIEDSEVLRVEVADGSVLGDVISRLSDLGFGLKGALGDNGGFLGSVLGFPGRVENLVQGPFEGSLHFFGVFVGSLVLPDELEVAKAVREGAVLFAIKRSSGRVVFPNVAVDKASGHLPDCVLGGANHPRRVAIRGTALDCGLGGCHQRRESGCVLFGSRDYDL